MGCLLAFPNRADESALTGGSWSLTMPLSKLQTRTIKDAARTSGVATSDTQFVATLPVDRGIRALAFVDHTMGLGATYRITAYDAPEMSAPVYDSGVRFVFPNAYGLDSIAWEDSRFWDGVPPSEYLDGLPATLIHLVGSEDVWARWWKVELVDTANAAGYIQIGRLFIGPAWVPVVNMSYGASLGYDPRTEIDEAYSGAEYFQVRPSPRVARFLLDGLSEDEAMAFAFDAQRVLGVSGEVLFMYDTADTTHLLRRSFVGRMRSLSPIQQAMLARYQTAYEIKELL